MSHRSQHGPIVMWAIVALTSLAWAYLVHLSRQMSAASADDAMMAAMGLAMHTPWTMSDVMLAFVMWTVMMVGMMAPSAAPILLLAASPRIPRDEPQSMSTVVCFGIGYLFVWTGFSAVAALAEWGLHDAALLSPAMAASSPWLAGVMLIVAGAYQLTPMKHVCLTHCRSPIDFLMGHWRSGYSGAVRMGAHHGLYCLGCCWALMGVLFVVGVMNLAWVAALALFVLVEKVAPGAVWVSRIAGVVMILAGAAKFWLL